MEKPNTTRRRWEWRVQGNHNRSCGPIMRSNCCCDSHSTTGRVSYKKGSISSAARTRACRPPLLLLLLLLWDVAGFRGRGAGPWRHRFRKYAVFLFFHPETRFQKSASSGSVRPKRYDTCAFSCGRPLNPDWRPLCLLLLFTEAISKLLTALWLLFSSLVSFKPFLF